MQKTLTIKDGERFGRLSIVRELDPVTIKRKDRLRRYRTFLCSCTCGKQVTVRLEYLRCGSVQSCGCYAIDKAAKRFRTHGQSRTPTYISWVHMKQRCDNKNDLWHQKYYHGISYTKRWLKYENFFADMGARPHGTTLDRIDPFGDYTKKNCRWATYKEQAKNKRKRPK